MRQLRIVFGAVLVSFVLGVGFFVTRDGGPPTNTAHVLDRRCRGGCSDTALLRVLPGGPSPAQTASGALQTNKGVNVVVTRASSQTCTAADGGIAYLSNNVPCVESAGYLSEVASTNLLIKSKALDNAAWTGGSLTSAAPTVTTDQAVAPDGTTTAEKLVYPAVGSSSASTRYQSWTATAAPYSLSIYLKAVSGSGTIYLFATDTIATYYRSACAVAATAWSRCTVTTGTLNASAWYFALGFDTRDAQSTTPGISVYAWGAQVELLPYASSFIPTDAATASRSADSFVNWGGASVAMSNTAGCFSACFTPQFAGGAVPTVSGSPASNLGYRFEGGGNFLYANAADTLETSTDGTTVAQVAGLFVQGVRNCYRTSWTANSRTMESANTGTRTVIASGYAGAFSSGNVLGGTAQGWVTDVAFGLTSGACSLPGAHVGVDALGDSITFGFGVTTPYPTTLTTLLGASAYYVTNSGVSGDTAQNMVTRWVGALDAKGFKYLILMAGTNDLRLSGRTATQVTTDLQTILDDAHTKGVLTVALTITPCSGDASCGAGVQSSIRTVNTNLATYAASHTTNTRLVDTWTLLHNPGSADALLGAYDSGDHLHPNQSGADAIAAAVQAVLPF